jgi:hypothetical protein
MTTRSLVIGCMVTALSGCLSAGGTHALVTPFGVAGVHSFAPVDKSRRSFDPDTINARERDARDENRRVARASR